MKNMHTKNKLHENLALVRKHFSTLNIIVHYKLLRTHEFSFSLNYLQFTEKFRMGKINTYHFLKFLWYQVEACTGEKVNSKQ